MLEFPKLGFSEILGEARFLGEYLRFRGDTMRPTSNASDRERRNPSENSRPILLIPGFMAGDASLYPLGARLRSEEHKVFYGGIWMNSDCPSKTLDRLQNRLHQVSIQTGRKVIVIGHSLGGIYARELARRESDLIERAFLLGSPIKHALGNTTPYLRPFVAAMRYMHGRCMENVSAPCDSCGLDLPEEAPNVPETCIYTKSDGIVEWHSCIDSGPQVECIEVDSSHCGIPLNPKAWEAIQHHLSRPALDVQPITVRANGAVARSRTHRGRPEHLKLVPRKSVSAA